MKTRMKIRKLTMEKGKTIRFKDLYNPTLYVHQKISQKLKPVRVCLGQLKKIDYFNNPNQLFSVTIKTQSPYLIILSFMPVPNIWHLVFSLGGFLTKPLSPARFIQLRDKLNVDMLPNVIHDSPNLGFGGGGHENILL